MDTSVARKTFDLANNILEVDPSDVIFKYDPAEEQRARNAKPWETDPKYFKTLKISAVALIKMVIHARSGGTHEIMGLMQGKVSGNSIVIVDSFALPVQGTETRVNAADEANEYMVQYLEGGHKSGRLEHAIGWYHSHPGYGCWLSGIDVDTQFTNQAYQDPFVAVVIDPNRTISAGKVDIGAFRTYPKDYKPAQSSSEYQSIPLNKIEDFGVHADQYYSLDVQIFKSKLDNELLGLLWNKYWVNTLSQSPLISNRAYASSQLTDLAAKLSRAQTSVAHRSNQTVTYVSPQGSHVDFNDPVRKPRGKEREKEMPGTKSSTNQEESALGKAVRDSTKIASEAQHGLISQILKDILFSHKPGKPTALQAVIDTSVE